MSSKAGQEIYAKAEDYWAKTSSDIDGMLGGFERLHVPDINASRAFLVDLRKKGYLTNFDRTIDCGCGIGRITKHLLVNFFATVDLVDVTEQFIAKTAEYLGDASSKVGEKFVVGLQEFEPQAQHYDLIWNQWVLGQLTDEDCVNYFIRCKDGLRENGCIVVKENITSSEEKDFDEVDSSWTRTKKELLDLFEQASLKVVLEKKQPNFPKGMYEVRYMITALKKKFVPSNSATSPRNGVTKVPMGVSPVAAELQKKFAHGVDFNMKIVIRGDRNTGKTCLWKRLQGKPFTEEYNPTDEIQVANITWNYRTTDHIVKLDVWDVVDESRKRLVKSEGLKLDIGQAPQTSADPNMMVCDAHFVDVYKNASGILMVFDVAKKWTWEYVCRELRNVPSTIPVLVLANKSDLDREVREEEVQNFIANFERSAVENGRLKAPIRLANTSMKTNLGLRMLYNFFNVPFLFLQREYLENSLESNLREIRIAQYELDCYGANGDVSPLEPKEAVASEQSEYEIPDAQRKLSIKSIDSSEEAKVNMYEEDFDSNDECHKTLDSFVSKPNESASLPTSPLEPQLESFPKLDSPSNHTSSPDSKTDNVQINLSTENPPEMYLDSWLNSSAAADLPPNGKTPKQITVSSDEDSPNPLVAKFEEEEEESPDGSASCSTTGFSVISNSSTVPPPMKPKKKKTAADQSLDNFLNPALQHTKTKTKTTKKKTKKLSQSKNILVEDSWNDEVAGDYNPI